MQTQLVIGYGQIGRAISSILNCDYADIDITPRFEQYDVLHICFPYSENFVSLVNEYKEKYKANLVCIHSTVKVGTTSQIENAVYSPCRGVRPNLEKGIRTFVKYFAGEKSSEIAQIFVKKGIECLSSNSERAVESLEAAKLWDTTQYGINILIEKEIFKYCTENKLDFNLVYTMFNETYNRGYDKLDMPQYKKYILKHVDGKIGGHCILPNVELLKNEFVDKIFAL